MREIDGLESRIAAAAAVLLVAFIDQGLCPGGDNHCNVKGENASWNVGGDVEFIIPYINLYSEYEDVAAGSVFRFFDISQNSICVGHLLDETSMVCTPRAQRPPRNVAKKPLYPNVIANEAQRPSCERLGKRPRHFQQRGTPSGS